MISKMFSENILVFLKLTLRTVRTSFFNFIQSTLYVATNCRCNRIQGSPSDLSNFVILNP